MRPHTANLCSPNILSLSDSISISEKCKYYPKIMHVWHLNLNTGMSSIEFNLENKGNALWQRSLLCRFFLKNFLTKYCPWSFVVCSEILDKGHLLITQSWIIVKWNSNKTLLFYFPYILLYYYCIVTVSRMSNSKKVYLTNDSYYKKKPTTTWTFGKLKKLHIRTINAKNRKDKSIMFTVFSSDKLCCTWQNSPANRQKRISDWIIFLFH